MPESSRIATFARGFFIFLKKQGVRAAVLHGGFDGFESELSDIDFVVDADCFFNLGSLIHEHCQRSGWQLCQVLRHETTAAFYVCSVVGDPACAVALDACSDYQRNGTPFLAAEILLENTRLLPWGGDGLSPANELCYRFAKAAAKNKDADGVAKEFAHYPDEVRRVCEAWLLQRWGIILSRWDSAGLAAGLGQLGRLSNQNPPVLRPGPLARIARRMQHPTGLLLITGPENFAATATRLENVFGHLYFRRCKTAQKWHPALIKDLIASTLIVLPKLEFPWSRLLPTACVHHLCSDLAPDTQYRELAKHLHRRCMDREHLGVKK